MHANGPARIEKFGVSPGRRQFIDSLMQAPRPPMRFSCVPLRFRGITVEVQSIHHQTAECREIGWKISRVVVGSSPGPARPHSTPLRDAALRPQFSLPAQSPVRVRTAVQRPTAAGGEKLVVLLDDSCRGYDDTTRQPFSCGAA